MSWEGRNEAVVKAVLAGIKLKKFGNETINNGGVDLEMLTKKFELLLNVLKGAFGLDIDSNETPSLSIALGTWSDITDPENPVTKIKVSVSDFNGEVGFGMMESYIQPDLYEGYVSKTGEGSGAGHGPFTFDSVELQLEYWDDISAWITQDSTTLEMAGETAKDWEVNAEPVAGRKYRVNASFHNFWQEHYAVDTVILPA